MKLPNFENRIIFIMKFIIEQINDADCRIVDVDCTGLNGKAVKELTIPATVEENGKTYKVKEVGNNLCFTKKSDMNAARYLAFRRLKKIVFSDGIERLGTIVNPGYPSNDEQRGNINSITEVVLPSTLKVLGEKVFVKCTSLSMMNIPDGLEEIGENALEGCSSLPIFQWPKSLKRIDLSALYGLSVPHDGNDDSTVDLEIPDTIESIKGSVGYSNLYRECRVSVKAWPALDASNLLRNISRLVIPEGVTKIMGKYEHMDYVSMPSTIEEIGPEAFKHCSALKDFKGLPESIRVIGEDAFKGCRFPDGVEEIRIPSAEVRVGMAAFYCKKRIKLTGDDATMASLMAQPGALNGTLVTDIIIPEGATEADINNCPELKTVSFPSTLKKITRISCCPKLKSIIIPDSVEEVYEIDDNAKLDTLKLPANLKLLGSICDCPSLKGELSFPDTLTKLLGNRKSWHSNFLKNLRADIKASPKIWGLICSHEYALYGYAPQSGELAIPEGVETLARYLLKNSEIKTLRLPASLRNINECAFEDCNNLKTVEFAPRSVNDEKIKLDHQIFVALGELESITFPVYNVDYGQPGDNIVARCKNFNKAIFPCDDPQSATYPVALGKLVDWYVPANMVAHTKAWVEESQELYPDVKGAGAKTIQPIVKLSQPRVIVKRSAPVRKKQPLTQPITMHLRMDANYEFAVHDEDMHFMESQLLKEVLAIKYMRENYSECSFSIRPASSTLNLDTKVDSATKDSWSSSEKTIVNIDFSDVSQLPEDFPEALASGLASAGDFSKLFASRLPNFGKELPDDAPAYIKVSVDFDLIFDFMIGEKEKFNVNKITVLPDWDNRKWNFSFFYKNRYIPATSIRCKYRYWVYPTIHSESIEGVTFRLNEFVPDTLPFLDEIITMMKLTDQ